jgi:hypothetical protein
VLSRSLLRDTKNFEIHFTKNVCTCVCCLSVCVLIWITELISGLNQLAKENPHFNILDVRGIGLMVGVEFNSNNVHAVPPGTASK